FAIFILLREYKKNNDKLIITLTCALLIGIFSELSFTLYVDVYGIYNYIGHLLKFIMYFIIFRVIFIQNIRQPYLELSAAKDEIKNYADNLDMIVEQRTEQINQIHQKLLDDLEYARDIQMAMLPKKLPNTLRATFEACYFPADRVGGDFYNVFKLEETKIGMYIGDVSGHGVSAAMLTVFLNQSIKTRKENNQGIKVTLPPSEVLANIYSDYNQTDFKSEVYIAMLYGIFDLSTGEFTFSSAGLNVPPMIVNSSGEVSELIIRGLPICKFLNGFNVEYNDSTVKLNKGDKVLFYTDGLTEAENRDKKVYSDLRLKVQLQKNKNLNALQLTRSITEHVFNFIENCKLRDDITFFIMEVK
ncbi:MAG TPA: SpoIIE family protein phosphatase, partial [Anaerovoracaceae bacterium]|nr:SpoIIE family protein phosphatase [Anaerovoracaceae bacterium]